VTIALAGLGGLLLAELAVRAGGLAPAPPPQYSGEILVRSPNPQLGFENRPGGRLVMRSRARRGDAEREVVARVNAQGFRGPEVERAKPPGTLRIACLGDSHTFGHGVGEGETWPDGLRERLAPAAGGARVEVMNCGVNAYNTLQEVVYLGEVVMPFEPDLVLLQVHLNDAAPRAAGGEGAGGTAAEAEAEAGWVLRWTSPRRDGFMRGLRGASAFADLACTWAYRRALLPVQMEAFGASYGEASPGWRQERDALAAAAQRLRDRGVPFAVVLYPYLVRRGAGYASHDAFELVKAACAERGIPCLDPEPALLRVPDAELHVHPSDVHGNARAHGIVAAETAAWLASTGLLERALERVD
jgi:hypothetical protein